MFFSKGPNYKESSNISREKTKASIMGGLSDWYITHGATNMVFMFVASCVICQSLKSYP